MELRAGTKIELAELTKLDLKYLGHLAHLLLFVNDTHYIYWNPFNKEIYTIVIKKPPA